MNCPKIGFCSQEAEATYWQLACHPQIVINYIQLWNRNHAYRRLLAWAYRFAQLNRTKWVHYKFLLLLETGIEYLPSWMVKKLLVLVRNLHKGFFGTPWCSRSKFDIATYIKKEGYLRMGHPLLIDNQVWLWLLLCQLIRSILPCLDLANLSKIAFRMVDTLFGTIPTH